MYVLPWKPDTIERERERETTTTKNRTEKAQSCSVKKIAMLLNIVCVNLQTRWEYFQCGKTQTIKTKCRAAEKEKKKKKRRKRVNMEMPLRLGPFCSLALSHWKKKRRKLKKDNNNTSLDID